MTATIASVTGATGAQASGNSTQRHLVYAVHSATWWAFWVDPATPTILRSAHSTDLQTWTAAGTQTLANAIGNTADGRYMSVAYASISGTDVVHVICSCASITGFDVRGVLTATTVTWATNSITNGNVTNSPSVPDGCVICTASDDGILLGASVIDTAGNFGDHAHTYNATADTVGASWTPGAWTTVDDHITSNLIIRNHAMIPVGSGQVVALWPADVNPPNNVVASLVGRSATPVAPGAVFGSTVAFSDTTANEWGACKVSNTDVHVVRRTGANTYAHARFNGTSWAAGQSIPTQTSLASAGVALTSDGASVYLVVIDSAAGNAVKVCAWNGVAWGAWATAEGSSATRTSISAMQEVPGASTIALIWTEGAASPFAIKVTSINAITPAGSGGQVPALVFGRRPSLISGSAGAAQRSGSSPILV
jgi:Tfp pilus assembly major pilin PilA